MNTMGGNRMSLEGNIAIVTGAGQGIGKAIAFMLASKGAIPVIVDIDENKAKQVVEELKNTGKESLAIKIDVSSVEEIKSMVHSVIDIYGKVDILVNNVAMLHSTAIKDITEPEWDRIMAVNLKSVFFISQQVLPNMEKNGYGRIINISSNAGRMGGYENGLAYSASKAAVIGLTYGMARRVAETGITVNVVAPGPTETNILKQLGPEKKRSLEAIIPMSRLGKPEEIAYVVAFLAGKEASYITGAVIDVNGGLFMG